MISLPHIIKWREYANWTTDAQVEQDLILSRILVEIFSDDFLSNELAFRGGTALHKLFFNPPARYSEDLDFVRTKTGPIKKVIDAIRDKLDNWLGTPISRRNQGRFTLYYNFLPETQETSIMRVKLEINTREHASLFGVHNKKFEVNNPWFVGNTNIKTYLLEELLSTKLRALYQRKKGRDLFDLALAFDRFSNLNIDQVVQGFNFYLGKENKKVTRAQFEENFYNKIQDKAFMGDTVQLIRSQNIDMNTAARKVYENFIAKLDGNIWKKQRFGDIDISRTTGNISTHKKTSHHQHSAAHKRAERPAITYHD